jgi:conjugative transposon TraK protein
MAFKSLTNIDSAFKFVRYVAFASIGMAVVICCFTAVYYGNLVEKQREKIYILDNGKSLILALQQDMTTNRPVELKSHITLFHEYMYTITPDAASIKNNIGRALELADKSAYNHYLNLQEAGYYKQILNSDVYQRIILDSIEMNTDVYPYEVRTIARAVIRRKSNITQRNLITTCKVIDVVRSDNNPHGFLIEGFAVIDNKEIQQEKR